MSTTLRFGRRQSVSLDVDPQRLVADCRQPQLPPVEDADRALRRALAAPLELPALRAMVVPGDKVTLAVEPDVPQAELVTSVAVEELVEAGIAPEDITLLVARRAPWIERLDPAYAARVQQVVHDARDRSQHCYLAASERNEPIYLNRALCDADLAIPIGAVHLDASLGYWGVAGQLYPALSHQRPRRRFRSPTAAQSATTSQQLREEASRVLWLLGVTFTIQVVPAGGDRLLGVLAGAVEPVERQGQEMCRQAWHFSVPGRASLAIAALSGGRRQQTWHNLARCISAILPAVEEGGVIAICSEVGGRPGPALKQLVTAGSPGQARKAIQRQHTADAIAAAQLASALERVRIYLLSRLDEDLVEDLGLTYVADPRELGNLARRHGRCLLVGNAQHTRIEVGCSP